METEAFHEAHRAEVYYRAAVIGQEGEIRQKFYRMWWDWARRSHDFLIGNRVADWVVGVLAGFVTRRNQRRYIAGVKERMRIAALRENHVQ